MRKTVSLLFCVMLIASCSKRQKAQEVVEQFLDQNLVNTEYTVNITRVDSTRNISDSIIHIMRQQAQQDRAFKKGIKYREKNGKESLMLARIALIQGTDTTSKTFYMDKEFTGIIAFKEY